MFALLMIVAIFLTIFFVVGTHEAAHFLAARWLNIKVLKFSIGFGKTLWRRVDRHGTEYVLALIPLGGYVEMLDEREGNVAEEEKHLAFNRQPYYKKILVIIAGPLSNLFCAFLLYAAIYMIGFTTIKPIIGEIIPHSIAAQSGLSAKQEIIAIDHHKTPAWTSVLFRLLVHAGSKDQAQITVANICTPPCRLHQQTVTVDLSQWQLNKLTPDPLKSLGLVPYQGRSHFILPNKELERHIQYSPLSAMQQSLQTIVNFTYFNLLFLGKILSGQLSIQSLGGPISIFESAGHALNYGLLPFISFLAFLSISIGIVNILPIPGLDGGHLFLYTLEWIIRRPIPDKVQLLLYRLGLIFIFIVLMQTIANDLLRL